LAGRFFRRVGQTTRGTSLKGEIVDQIFNELSLSGAHSDKYRALQAMYDVCQASVSLEKLGFCRSVRTTRDFATRELAKGYTYNDWIVDKDARIAFKDMYSLMLSRFSKSPYVESLCQEHGMTEFEEYRFDESNHCFGLALAHIWGIPALSLAGDTRFADDEISFSRNVMDEDANIASHPCRVLRLSREADISKHEDKVRACLMPDIPNGAVLLEKAAVTFPYLAFCGDAPWQLEGMDRNDMYFRTIVGILQALNEAMRLVDRPEAEFAPQGIHYIPGERSTTMDMPKARAARTFSCPDGIRREFWEHVRINRALRVHLFSDRPNKRVYIGHVGEHLPTARFS